MPDEKMQKKYSRECFFLQNIPDLMAVSLSIIIVNYKTAPLLVDCLQSLYSQGSSLEMEVIVVDNASGDDSFQVITSRFPSVKWVQMSYNSGFARANNEGIRLSQGNVVLLLNSDTIVEGNAIEKCYRAFLQDEYVACGLQLMNADRSPQISGNYAMKGGLNYVLPLPYLGNAFRWLGQLARIKKPHVPDTKQVVEVDWINGAFLMVKKTAIEKAGMLDEDFFLYAEEAEWCGRLKKTGKLCIYGQFSIVHLQGETANETFGSSGKGYYNLYDRKGLQIILSNFVRIRKQFGIGWFLFMLGMYTLAIPVFFIGSFIEGLLRLHNPFSAFPRAGRLASNVGKLWKFSPTIIGNKPHFYKVL